MADKALKRCLNVADVRSLARRRTPRPIFDIIDSGREDEITLCRNVRDFQEVEIIPRLLRDVEQVEAGVHILGCDLSFPLILAPTGAQGILHPGGEIAAARAAARAGVMYALSSFASETLEAVAEVGKGPRLFQLNAFVDDELNRELVRRASDAGYDAFCLTVDNPVSSRAERVERWRLSPSRLLPIRTAIEFARKPGWLLKHRHLKRDMIPYAVRELARKGMSVRPDDLGGMSKGVFRRDLTWQKVKELRRQWDGPFVLKGILSPDDAERAVDLGANAIVVCNHGGLALDGAPSSISMLGQIADRVGGKCEIILGSGIRRGTSIVKSLALGAQATMAGRAFLYGLAAAGETGVAHVIELLRAEFTTALAASGCTRCEQLDSDLVRRRHAQPAPANPSHV